MREFAKAVKITDKVYWVGAIDWSIKDFHGYSTDRGTTYNAYLVLADKITLIDTVKAPFREELMSRIKSVIDPGKIDIIVSNHAEMDHSGSLRQVVAEVKPEKVFASAMGVKTLNAHFDLDFEITPVKTGDGISLGNMELTFVETKMLHWPDSMFTYLKEEKILFSQDAFGMHLATDRLFEDENEPDIIHWEALKYFANILLPYCPQITRLVESLPDLNLDIRMIAPDHGPIWRKDPMVPVKKYTEWAKQKPNKKVIIIYDTMWQSTALMARTVADGVMESGAEPHVIHMGSKDRSFAATMMLDAGGLIVGSPTLNNNIFPTMADVLTYLKGLRPKNLIGGAFGSYGWGGEAVRQLNEYLEDMSVELVSEGVKVKYVPGNEDLQQCRELGKNVGEKLIELIGKK